MRLGKQIIWVACLALANCGSGTFVRSEFGSQVDAILIKHNSPNRWKVIKSLSVEQAMQLVVLDMTKGLSRENATKVFVADGANCLETTCTWEKFEQLSVIEKMVGKLPPNPVERWKNVYSVELVSPQIMSTTDVQTSFKYMEPLE